jgi:hypothetical protein
LHRFWTKKLGCRKFGQRRMMMKKKRMMIKIKITERKKKKKHTKEADQRKPNKVTNSKKLFKLLKHSQA